MALVHHVFTGRDPPNASQLDYVALFWVKGFAGIGDAFSRDKAPGAVFPRPEFDIWQELWIACLLFAWMLFSVSIYGYLLSLAGWIIGGIWQAFVIAAGFVFNLLYMTPGVSV